MAAAEPTANDPNSTEAAATAKGKSDIRHGSVGKDLGLPEGHVLPPSYELRPPGRAIFHVVHRTHPRTQKETEAVTRVTYGPLFVARLCAAADGEQWFDLQWLDHTRTVSRRVDGAVLRDGYDLVDELGRVGIPAIKADGKHLERYLAAYLVANRHVLEATRMTIARHLGWQEDGTTFVTADGQPWPVEPGQPEQRPALAAHHPKGTLDGWQAAVAPVEHYPAVRIALAASFAAPLLRPLNLSSFTLDISGRSTRGKTTAAATTLSPWADPTAHGEGMATWKSGVIMIEKRLNLVRGLPVVLDETRVVKSPDIVDQILYQVPMNHGAARGGGWASLLPWHTILISTGEQPALSFTSHEGAAARVLSLRRAPFGTDGPRSAADARTVAAGIGEHYGVAGPAYISALLEHLADSHRAAKLLQRHGALVDAHVEAARNDIARRRAPLVAALHLAAQLAYEWEIVPFSAPDVELFTEHLSEESAREDRGEMALDVVRSLVAAQGHRLAPLNRQAGALDVAPAGGWIGAHCEYEGAPAVALLPEALADALNRANPPITLDAVREAWIERGTIPLDKARKLPRIWMGGPRPRCYVFAEHILDGEETPDGVAQQAAEPVPETPDFVQEELGAGGWPKGSYGDLAWRERPQP